MQQFLTHYLRSAQSLAREARLVSLPNETVAAELKWLTGEQAPLLYAPDDTSTAPAQPAPSENPAR